jgi:hypothetical protein
MRFSYSIYTWIWYEIKKNYQLMVEEDVLEITGCSLSCVRGKRVHIRTTFRRSGVQKEG